MTTYKIIRFFKDNEHLNRSVVARGLTLEEAQAHCHDPQTSSTTATNNEGVIRTQQFGPWFDGYEEEK